MNEYANFVFEKRLQKASAALQKNRMEAYIVETAKDVVPLLKTLLAPGSTVTSGGSQTLTECGILEFLRGGDYTFLDRENPGPEGNDVLCRRAFFADSYLASANAVTLNGEIYEVDGKGNRVAAIAFGPASVILVVGRNKIVSNLEEARQRRAQIAAPANVHRMGLQTPCATTGTCSDCKSPARICCTELVLQQQRIENRIKVVLVNEELGF